MRAIVALVVLSLIGACSPTGKPQGPPPNQSVPRPPAENATDAHGIAAFAAQLKEYALLHDRVERTLPALPKDATPQQIDQHQRALAQLILKNRSAARRGDLFTAAGERAIRGLVADLLKGADGGKIRSTIMDENPVAVKLSVNGRYPDAVPLSTVPPQILAALPKLPEELEYRFIGPRLILLDIHAHTVADYIENALS
jgi:hypothetical protein